ncbi:MAG: hypothetical protein KDI83_12470 [Gammaproteobacteria bacterium]|nr:hypothetical protein [Gammaproteobacteria bacterium]
MIDRTITPPSSLKGVFIPALVGAFVGALSIGVALAGVPLWVSIFLCIFGVACIFFSYLYIRKTYWPFVLILAGLGVLLTTPAIAGSLFLRFIDNILSYFGYLLGSKYLEELLKPLISQSVTETDYFVAVVGIILIVIGAASQLVLAKIQNAPIVTEVVPDEPKKNTFEENKNVWSHFVNSDEFTTWKVHASMPWPPPMDELNSENKFLDEIHPVILDALEGKVMDDWQAAPKVKAKIDDYLHCWKEYYSNSIKYCDLTFPLTQYAGLNELTGGFSSFADSVIEYIDNGQTKPPTDESKARDKDVFNRIQAIREKYHAKDNVELRNSKKYNEDVKNIKKKIENNYSVLIEKWSEVQQEIKVQNAKYGMTL